MSLWPCTGKYEVQQSDISGRSVEDDTLSNNLRRPSAMNANRDHHLQRRSTLESDTVITHPVAQALPEQVSQTYSSLPSIQGEQDSEDIAPPLPPRRPRPQFTGSRSQTLPRAVSAIFMSSQTPSLLRQPQGFSNEDLGNNNQRLFLSNGHLERDFGPGQYPGPGEMTFIRYNERRNPSDQVQLPWTELSSWVNARYHVDDLPPSYEEAMRMKTLDSIEQPKPIE